jgi:succinoglycan biosynthesis protein ExoV
LKLFYYQDPEGNFGDDLNRWLWPRLAPGLLDEDNSTLFVAIGSILDRRIPQGPEKVVFGSGVGYGLLPVLDPTWHICCVRGPLSAKALGLPPATAVTDSAALVRAVRKRPGSGRGDGHVTFIPHFRTPRRAEALGLRLERIVAGLGIEYVDPRGDVEGILDRIERSRVVIAEAMHGAIVADALRVPWVPVRLFDQVLSLKWRDWCASLGIEYRPLSCLPDPGADLPAGREGAIRRVLRDAAAYPAPLLSAPGVLDSAVERLTGLLEDVKLRRWDRCVEGSDRLRAEPDVLREVPWLHRMQQALEEVAAAIPRGATFIMVDEERWGGGQVLAGRNSLPFMEREGAYWGLPPASDIAVQELERLRAAGARYIVFMEPSFWWLEYYAGLRDHLEQRYEMTVQSPNIKVFAL